MTEHPFLFFACAVLAGVAVAVVFEMVWPAVGSTPGPYPLDRCAPASPVVVSPATAPNVCPVRYQP